MVRNYVQTFTIKAVVKVSGHNQDEAVENATDQIMELLPEGWEIWDSELEVDYGD